MKALTLIFGLLVMCLILLSILVFIQENNIKHLRVRVEYLESNTQDLYSKNLKNAQQIYANMKTIEQMQVTNIRFLHSQIEFNTAVVDKFRGR